MHAGGGRIADWYAPARRGSRWKIGLREYMSELQKEERMDEFEAEPQPLRCS